MVDIRSYDESDALVLWKIFFNTIRTVNSRDYTKEQLEAWAPDSFDVEVWKERMIGINPFVAEIDGVVVGYSDLQSSGLIDHFFCHHSFQRQGVGRALMERIFTEGKAIGISRYYSEVSKTARPFYEQFGFSVVKQQLIEVRGQKFTNYLMEKEVSITLEIR